MLRAATVSSIVMTTSKISLYIKVLLSKIIQRKQFVPLAMARLLNLMSSLAKKEVKQQM